MASRNNLASVGQGYHAPASGSRDLTFKHEVGPVPQKLYEYDALPTETSIRLIEWPRNVVPSADLRIRLRTVDIASSDHPPYTTLSYTWGAESGLEAEDTESLNDLFTNTVVCHDDYLRVTENAWSALAEMQWRGRAHLFWLDAVCIDQNNIEERSHQVAIMGEIYANAERTIVWLGEDDESARVAHKVLQHVDVKMYQSLSVSGREDLEQLLFTPSGWTTDEVTKLIKDTPTSFLQLRPRAHLWPDLINFLNFFSRSWFQRMWVIQEVVLSKQLWIVCGGLTFDWQALVDVAHNRRLEEIVFGVEDDEVIAKGSHGFSVIRAMALLRGDYSTFQKMASNMFGFTSEAGEFCAIVGTLIDLFENSMLSDSRDRVYAPLALASRLCKSRTLHNLVPNYTQSVEEVFTTTAEYFLRESNCLNMLAMTKTTDQRREQSMPSWVPDLRIRSAQKAISKLCSSNATKGWLIPPLANTSHALPSSTSTGHTALPHGYDSLSPGSPAFQITNDHQLGVNGIMLTKISQITACISQLIDEDNILPILNFGHEFAQRRRQVKQWPQLLLNTLVFASTWMDNPFMLMTPITSDFSSWLSMKLLSAHYRDQLCSQKINALFDPLGMSADWFCSKHAAITNPNWIKGWSKCIVCNNPGSLYKRKKDLDKLILGGQRDAVMSLNAIVKRANLIHCMILAHRAGKDTSEGLMEFWTEGSRFQSACKPYITGRSLHIDEDGRLGLCPYNAGPGDQIWFLFGAKAPVILRPVVNGNFQLVGEAYVDGYMDGKICQQYSIDQLRRIVLE